MPPRSTPPSVRLRALVEAKIGPRGLQGRKSGGGESPYTALARECGMTSQQLHERLASESPIKINTARLILRAIGLDIGALDGSRKVRAASRRWPPYKRLRNAVEAHRGELSVKEVAAAA